MTAWTYLSLDWCFFKGFLRSSSVSASSSKSLKDSMSVWKTFNIKVFLFSKHCFFRKLVQQQTSYYPVFLSALTFRRFTYIFNFFFFNCSIGLVSKELRYTFSYTNLFNLSSLILLISLGSYSSFQLRPCYLFSNDKIA